MPRATYPLAIYLPDVMDFVTVTGAKMQFRDDEQILLIVCFHAASGKEILLTTSELETMFQVYSVPF